MEDPSFENVRVGVLVHRNAPVIRSFEDHRRRGLTKRLYSACKLGGNRKNVFFNRRLEGGFFGNSERRRIATRRRALIAARAALVVTSG